MSERCQCGKPLVDVGANIKCCTNAKYPHAWEGFVGLNGAALRLAIILRDQNQDPLPAAEDAPIDLTPHLRQYQHNDCSGFVFGYDKAGIERLVANLPSRLNAAEDAQLPDLKAVPSDELRLELALRSGPRFQCQSPDCRSFHSSPGKWDTCPSCGRKGYLCGSFKEDRESSLWKDWERRTIENYRPAAPAMSQDSKGEV